MKEKHKNNRGVTIIALVVTIIVMLILAGVTLSNITGGNGMFFNAKRSKDMTEIEEEKRILNISIMSAIKSSANGKISEDNLKVALDNNNLKDKYEINKKDDLKYGTIFEITIKKSMNVYTILEDGTLVEEESDEIVLNPNSIPSLIIGKTTEIQAETTSSSKINWKTSNEEIVVINEDSTDNKKIKISGLKSGSATIEASIEIKKGDVTETKTAFCKVNVVNEQAEQVKKILLNTSNVLIDLGTDDNRIQLIPEVDSNDNSELSWTTSNPLIATVDNNGIVTGKSNGIALISVQAGNGINAQCIVTIQTSPNKIIIEESYITLDLTNSNVAPKSKKVKVRIEPETTNVNNEVEWISSNNSIVTIRADGEDSTTAIITGINSGDGKIIVQTPNGKKSEAIVKVQSTPVSN